MQKTNNYVDKGKMYDELVKMKETGVASDELHVMWYEMAKQIATKKNFRNYTYIEDMITEAYMRCVHYKDKFDVTKSREPFSYFTITILRSFMAYLKKEKRYQKRKWDELRSLVEKMEHEYQITLELNDNLKEKIYNYTGEAVEIPDEENYKDDSGSTDE